MTPVRLLSNDFVSSSVEHIGDGSKRVARSVVQVNASSVRLPGQDTDLRRGDAAIMSGLHGRFLLAGSPPLEIRAFTEMVTLVNAPAQIGLLTSQKD